MKGRKALVDFYLFYKIHFKKYCGYKNKKGLSLHLENKT